MATQSSIPAWKIPWTEEPGRLQSMGCKELDTTEQLHFSITSWQIDGENEEMVTDLITLDFKIIENGDCSHEIKRCLLLGRKAMTKLNSILKAETLLYPQRSI